MSAPVYHGVAFQLTVRNSDREISMPPSAAMRAHRPSSVPVPTAISPAAMSSPKATEWCSTGPSSPPIGLCVRTASNVARSDPGAEPSKKLRPPTFDSPA